MALLLEGIQGNIFPGFKKDHQAFLFVRFPGPPPDLSAQAWLSQIRHSIARADEVQAFNAMYKIVAGHRGDRADQAVRATWVNVGFSYPGLQKLQTLSIANFPVEFTQGMHARANVIGDVPAEQPGWLVGGSTATLPDAIIVIAADVRADLDSEIEHQRQALLTHGLSEMALFDGRSLGSGTGHFGWKDNITDPKPVESGASSATADEVPYTEFVLGPGHPHHGPDPMPPAWTENGSYMVIRRLRQHVAAFRDRAAQIAAALSPFGPDGVTLTGPYIQAKCMGRWPDGTPVSDAPAPMLPGPSTDITAMDYITDNVGWKIPRFSHVRKGHPRQLGKDASGNDIPGADLAKHHRLIRRGITYGAPLPLGSADDGVDRGLVFVGYQASLHEQFERIASGWMNRRTFPDLDLRVDTASIGDRSAGEDPIAGVRADSPDQQRLIMYPTSVTSTGIRTGLTVQPFLLDRFVTMTGGGYFFCPGIAILAQLAGE